MYKQPAWPPEPSADQRETGQPESWVGLSRLLSSLFYYSFVRRPCMFCFHVLRNTRYLTMDTMDVTTAFTVRDHSRISSFYPSLRSFHKQWSVGANKAVALPVCKEATLAKSAPSVKKIRGASRARLTFLLHSEKSVDER